jgi:hypothetical protein
MKWIALIAALLLAACEAAPVPPPPVAPQAVAPPPGPVPAFATKPDEPFNRADTPPQGRPVPLPQDKPERQPGLWQRVGEYWWTALAVPAGAPVPHEEYYTGKHDESSGLFPASDDARYAWSAAFISYVMRVAGAGPRFPYSANHATYVNAAAAHASPILQALAPPSYAPQPGDLICFGRSGAQSIKFTDLPTSYGWPGHCAIVTAIRPGMLDTLGGNVDDAVTLVHVPVTDSGALATPDGAVVDQRYPWFVVLRVLYDAETEPPGDE